MSYPEAANALLNTQSESLMCFSLTLECLGVILCQMNQKNGKVNPLSQILSLSLRRHNSANGYARQLFKPSKDSTSL